MTQAQLGILIGGLLPAVFFGISGICQKISSQYGVGPGAFLIGTGVGVILVGVGVTVVQARQTINLASGLAAGSMGVFWGLGVMCVVTALNQYKAPLAVLAPLYNMNTVVTVLGSLILFSEWDQVHPWKLGMGVLMIIAGGVLVSN
ncbi:hypothetical protein [Rubritalea marina]|uniref:hypothetical protein n=1 Tax=Rubritalea marina TaxID=361055 RepID=UPI00037EA455|nr:hypothetical protein [Rubritalea marina]